MKKFVLLNLSILLFGFASAAQENLSQTQSPTEIQKSGFSVGAEYINVTDMRINVKSSRFGDRSISYGEHLGMGGVGLGYSKVQENGLGMLLKLRILQSINKSEVGEDGTNINMFIPEANLTYSFNDLISVYGGANLSVWRGTEFINKFTPGFGLQAGLAIESRQVSFHLGSTLMSQTYKETYEYNSYNYGGAKEELEATILASGFSAGLSYRF